MSEIPESWSVMGAGNVGSALIDMIAKPYVAANHNLQQQPIGVLRRDGWHENSKDGVLIETDSHKLPDSDILFIAAPSTADNQPMLSFMRQQLALGRTVITAEKRTLADNFAEFKQTRNRLGYWATVGGGTRLLPTLELWAQDPDNVREMIVAPNATLTFMYGEIGNGQDPDETVRQACDTGLAEPGTTDLFDVIFAEAVNDVPSKLVIALGTIFPHLAELPPSAINTALSREDITHSLAEADKYRYLTAIFQAKDALRAHRMTESKRGGFELIHESLLIIGGLLRVDVNQATNAIGRFRGTRGPDAGFYVELGPHASGPDAADRKSTSDGQVFAMGTGAGGLTTANAMLDNHRAIRTKVPLKNS